MSNSPLVVHTKISPNKSSPRNKPIDTITIHCAVGQVTAESLGGWMYQSSTQASSNYCVDKDGRVGMYVEEKDRSWCTSSGANDNRAITIEVASDTTHPYAVTDKALAALIELVTDVCQRNGIKQLIWRPDKDNPGNMTVHRWFANKSCPGDYLYARHGYIADEVNKRLNILAAPQTLEDGYQKFAAYMAQYKKETATLDAAAWSDAARAWNERVGLIQGVDAAGAMQWKSPVTREMALVIIHRYHEQIVQPLIDALRALMPDGK